MKILILSLLFSLSSFSGEIFFQGPCHEKPFLEKETAGAGLTAGALTVSTLEENQIEFIGAEAGINSILGTPVGLEAIEIISKTHMRAYGWCYQIDGFEPTAMPDQIILEGTEQVRWFFAYGTYLNGEWKDYCTPSYELKSPFLCPN